MSPSKYTERLKCGLTQDEIGDAAKLLAQSTQRLARLEDEKKQVDSQLKADMAVCEAEMNRLASYICTGSEFRDVPCTVQLDTPSSGLKTIIRMDTGEVVRETRMTDEDRQMSLDLQKRAEDEQKAREDAERLRNPPMSQLEAAPEVIQGETFTVSNGAVHATAKEMWGIDKEGISFYPAGAHPPLETHDVIVSTQGELAAFLENWSGHQIKELHDQNFPNATSLDPKKGRGRAIERIWEAMQGLRGQL